jgi:hypothetical protein
MGTAIMGKDMVFMVHDEKRYVLAEETCQHDVNINGQHDVICVAKRQT